MKYRTTPEHAQKCLDWIMNRGGLAHWKSANLSNPGASWTTPRLQEDGFPFLTKPSWQAESQPWAFTIDPDDVIIEVPKEIRRFRITIRMGSQGTMLKVTDASTRKIRRAVEFAEKRTGKSCWYRFGYGTQEAIILVADQEFPLTTWLNANPVWTPETCI